MNIEEEDELPPVEAYKSWHAKLMMLRKGARIRGYDEDSIEAELDDIYAELNQEERKLVKVYVNEGLHSRKIH